MNPAREQPKLFVKKSGVDVFAEEIMIAVSKGKGDSPAANARRRA